MARRDYVPSRSRMLWAVFCLMLCNLCFLGNAWGTTLTVTTTADSGAGSLRAAITTANADSGDTINITATGTITLLSALPTITADMTITGPGANLLTVSGNNSSTVGTIFTVATGVTASISGLTIANGNSSSSDQGGGGILNDGTLTVSTCTISGNSGTGSVNNEGGGITNFGTLTVSSSTFSGNSAATGGGIFNGDGNTLTVTNSTFSANSATAKGGGIYNLTGGTLTVTNSTISANSSGDGGGIETNSSATTITNSIVAGNTATAADDIDGTFTNGGGNVITPATPIALAPLANYGGPTQTMLPLPNSPAICAGATNALTTDQRGFTITSTYCASGKKDSGAVQTSYTAIQFTNPNAGIGGYAAYMNNPASFFPAAPIVSVTENGQNIGGVPVTLTFSGAGTATGLGPTTTIAGTGATFSGISVNEAGSDTLSAQLTPGSATLNTSANLKIVVITVSPSTLAGATLNRPYSVTFSASGGTTSTYTFSLTGVPPTGVTFNAGTATLAGTPTQTGVFALTVTATDSNGFSGSQNYTLTVNTTVTVTQAVPTTTLTVNQAGVSFTPVTASGGTTPLTYGVVPTLPAGLSMSTSTGAITGTPSAASAAATYTVTVADVNGSSAAATFSLTVSKATPTVSLAPPSGTSNLNQSLTCTATVAPSPAGSTLPGGTVTFNTALNGGSVTPIAGCTSQPITSGQATCSTAALLAGSNSVTAVYNGDTNFNTATSTASTQTVNKVASTTVLNSSPNPSNVNQSVTFTATVSPSSATVGLSGAVAFSDGSNPIAGCGSVPLTSGVAMCTTAALAGGAHTINANYINDPNYLTSTTNHPQMVTPVASATSVVSSSAGNTSTVDTSVTFTATVTPFSAIVKLSGSVTFTDNGSPITGCAIPVTPATGVAQCTTSSLKAGSHAIVATFGSDPSYVTSNNNVTQTVNEAGSVTQVATSGSPSTVNAPVTFTATVTPFTGAVKLSGSVTFTDGANPITGCTAPVTVNPANGQAICTTGALALGTHSIKATYANDTNFTTSNNTVAQMVNAAGSSTALVSSSSTSTVNQPVTFTATVTATSGATPLSGSITFTDSGNPIAACGSPVPVNPANGVATCTTASLTAGPHTIKAAYGSDPSFAASSGTAMQTVAQAPSSTALVSSTLSSTVNEPVTFTATVTPITGTVKLSGTGTVTFTDNNNPISGCSAFNATTGIATCTTATLALGPHTIVATYGNDTNFSGSSGTVIQTVGQAPTSLTVTTSQNNSTVNQPITLTATVSGASGAVKFAGTVTFIDNGNPLAGCAVPVNPATGVANCSTSSLTAGTHTIVGKYANDPNFAATQGSLTQTVNPATSSVTLASSSISSVVNQTVTFTADVTPISGPVKLSGAVVFTDNGNPLTGCTVTFNPTTGVATCSTASLALGSHTIVATYGSDTNYTSNHASVPQIVGQASTSTVVVSSSASNTSTINESVTFTATVTTPIAGAATLSGTVTFTDNNNPITGCAVVVNPVTGLASCTTASLTLGSHTIAATYGSDTNFSGSHSTLMQTVNQAASSTALISSSASNTSNINQSVNFTATVTAPAGTTKLSGTVTFTNNGNTIAGCALPIVPANGAATTGTAICTTAALTAGSHTILATYANDQDFSTSSKSLTQTVNTIASGTGVATSLTPSIVRNPLGFHDSVIFTATVTPISGPVQLSGAVSFTDNGTAIPECQTAIPVNPTTGVATCSTISLTSGTHVILMSYGGDPNFKSSNNSLTQTVQDYTLTSSPTAAVTVTQGFTSINDPFTPQVNSSGASTITTMAAPVQGFTGSLALSCTVAQVTATSNAVLPQCLLGSSALTINPAPPQTPVTITIDAFNSGNTPATSGAYTVTVAGLDSATGLIRTTTFALNVRYLAGPLNLTSGAVTGNTIPVNFDLPAGVGLSSIQCASASAGPPFTTFVDPAGFSIACTFSPTSVGSSANPQVASVTVSITTDGTVTAMLMNHTSIFAASLLGIPILAFIGFLRGGKASGKSFFRFLGVVFLMAAVLQGIGCGGSFTRASTATGGLTPAGSYLLLVQGTGTDKQVYTAVVQVNVVR